MIARFYDDWGWALWILADVLLASLAIGIIGAVADDRRRRKYNAKPGGTCPM